MVNGRFIIIHHHRAFEDEAGGFGVVKAGGADGLRRRGEDINGYTAIVEVL